jgi:hypothetical protein
MAAHGEAPLVAAKRYGADFEKVQSRGLNLRHVAPPTKSGQSQIIPAAAANGHCARVVVIPHSRMDGRVQE